MKPEVNPPEVRAALSRQLAADPLGLYAVSFQDRRLQVFLMLWMRRPNSSPNTKASVVKVTTSRIGLRHHEDR